MAARRPAAAGGTRGLLLVTTSFPQQVGGSEAAGSFVADLAIALAAQVPVRVVAPGDRDARESWPGGVEVYRYAAPIQPLASLRVWDPRHWPAIVGTLRAGTRAAIAAGDGCAHSLALWALPSGWWARRLARVRGVPYSVWMLGSDVWTMGKIPLIRNVLAATMRGAAHRFADGLQLADDSRALCGKPVEFLPSTRTIERRRESPLATQPPYRLLFLGRWHTNKGTDLLLDALARLDDGDWARIRVVEIQGGGPLRPLVQQRVAQLQASGRPVVLGDYLEKDAAIDAFLRADWALIPSRIESIPVVFSDAMKLGCPVVATPVGDLPRLIERYGAGICASAVDAEALAAALRRALAAPPAQFAEGLVAAAQAFSLEQAVLPRVLALVDHPP